MEDSLLLIEQAIAQANLHASPSLSIGMPSVRSTKVIFGCRHIAC